MSIFLNISVLFNGTNEGKYALKPQSWFHGIILPKSFCLKKVLILNILICKWRRTKLFAPFFNLVIYMFADFWFKWFSFLFNENYIILAIVVHTMTFVHIFFDVDLLFCLLTTFWTIIMNNRLFSLMEHICKDNALTLPSEYLLTPTFLLASRTNQVLTTRKLTFCPRKSLSNQISFSASLVNCPHYNIDG